MIIKRVATMDTSGDSLLNSSFFFFRRNFTKMRHRPFVKRIFYHRFFEILKKNRQTKSMGFVLGSPDLEALLL